MRLVRNFTLHCFHFNLLFLARHVPGGVNEVTYTLSCKHMERFCQLAPDIDPDLVHIPEEMWSIGGTRRRYNQAVQQFGAF